MTKIIGYHELTEDEINAINAIKQIAIDVKSLLDSLQSQDSVIHKNLSIDSRWDAIARTDLQKGFMAAIRSIAKPEGF